MSAALIFGERAPADRHADRILSALRAKPENEGIDPDLVRDVLDLHLSLSLDEILDLIIDYDPALEFFEQLAGIGSVQESDARRLLDYDIEPADVARLREVGLAISITDAIDIVDEGGTLVFSAMDTNPVWSEARDPGRYVATAWIPEHLLNEGTLHVTVSVKSALLV